MCKEKIIYNRTAWRGRLPLPDTPESEWTDMRRDYESGMTQKEIAEKYFCDVRTVRNCLLHDYSSSEIGRQKAPTKISEYRDRIDELYREYAFFHNDLLSQPGTGKICQISQRITDEITKEGYSGKERTVRNYLRVTYQHVEDPGKPEGE